MSLEIIKDWLQSERSYEHGLKLFIKLGADPVRAAFFSKGESELRREMLIESMLALQEQFEVPLDPVVEAEKALKKVITSDEEYDSMSSVHQEIVKKVKELYKKGAAMKARLFLIPDKRERAIVANTIRDFDEEATRLLEQIDYIRKHGKVPDQAVDGLNLSDLSSVELLRLKSHLEQRRSRAKKNPLKAEEVLKLTEQLELVRKKIDADAI